VSLIIAVSAVDFVGAIIGALIGGVLACVWMWWTGRW
jgi:hypothetical protein